MRATFFHHFSKTLTKIDPDDIKFYPVTLFNKGHIVHHEDSYKFYTDEYTDYIEKNSPTGAMKYIREEKPAETETLEQYIKSNLQVISLVYGDYTFGYCIFNYEIYNLKKPENFTIIIQKLSIDFSLYNTPILVKLLKVVISKLLSFNGVVDIMLATEPTKLFLKHALFKKLGFSSYCTSMILYK